MTFSLTTKLAACVSRIFEISHEDQKRMTAAQVLSLVEWDHYPIRRAEGGLDEHWNCWARLIAEHGEKTRKRDVPEIAKNKRIARKHQEHQRRLLWDHKQHAWVDAPRKRRWPSRTFPKRAR